VGTPFVPTKSPQIQEVVSVEPRIDRQKPDIPPESTYYSAEVVQTEVALLGIYREMHELRKRAGAIEGVHDDRMAILVALATGIAGRIEVRDNLIAMGWYNRPNDFMPQPLDSADPTEVTVEW
jgi:hypothetical protein